MTWKAIGASIVGTAHTERGKPCEDALCYDIFLDNEGREVLAVCASDGAGSASFAELAASYCVKQTIALLKEAVATGASIDDTLIYRVAETLYGHLQDKAAEMEVPIEAFYCTWLGALILPGKSIFFQIGDGAIARTDPDGLFHTIWWPGYGEYLNVTDFLVEDENFSNLHVTIYDGCINDLVIFTDGIQMLCLNFQTESVHQPFFDGLFKHLQKVPSDDQLKYLEQQLGHYLNSDVINNRTDDDKTLFLATCN